MFYPADDVIWEWSLWVSVNLSESYRVHFSREFHTFEPKTGELLTPVLFSRMETSSVRWKHASQSPAPRRSRFQTPAVWCVKVDKLPRAEAARQQELVRRSLPHAVLLGLQIAAAAASLPRKMEPSSWTEGWYVLTHSPPASTLKLLSV